MRIRLNRVSVCEGERETETETELGRGTAVNRRSLFCLRITHLPLRYDTLFEVGVDKRQDIVSPCLPDIGRSPLSCSR